MFNHITYHSREYLFSRRIHIRYCHISVITYIDIELHVYFFSKLQYTAVDNCQTTTGFTIMLSFFKYDNYDISHQIIP